MSSKTNRHRKKGAHRPASASVHDKVVAAIRQHQQGKVEEATAAYRQVLQAWPDQVDALHFLGVAEHQLGRSEQALTLLGRALALQPDHPDALNNRGNILKKLRRLDEAEADYRRALTLRPRDANALNNLGTVCRERGELEDAVTTLREAIAAKPDHAAAWQNLGNALGGLHRLEEALEAHQEAMRLAPQSADSYRYLGAMLYAVGRIQEAADVYREWLALFPDDPRAQHLVAACTGEAVPERASDAYVRSEFDSFASSFDDSLARLDYRAPALVAEAIAKIFGAPTARLAVLDAGCGTGLCGPLLRPFARTLAGVDLSAAMVALARDRKVYDTLVVEELTTFLRHQGGSCDLIVSADTLVYFGELNQVGAAAALALRRGGHLVFTVERAEPQHAPAGYRINPHGRYSHTRDYLCTVLAQAGFVKSDIREVCLRKEAEKWVDGWLVCAATPDG
jgi:predicted TPR repeat methyltransferase